MAYHSLAPFYAAPTTGGTVTIPAFDGPLLVVFLNPAGTLATLTTVLPAAAADGQMVVLMSSQILTALTLTAGVGSVLNAITTLAANGSARYVYSATANKWFSA